MLRSCAHGLSRQCHVHKRHPILRETQEGIRRYSGRHSRLPENRGTLVPFAGWLPTLRCHVQDHGKAWIIARHAMLHAPRDLAAGGEGHANPNPPGKEHGTALAREPHLEQLGHLRRRRVQRQRLLAQLCGPAPLLQAQRGARPSVARLQPASPALHPLDDSSAGLKGNS